MKFDLCKHDGYREVQDKYQELNARSLELTNEVRELMAACSRPRDSIRDEAMSLLHDSYVATATVSRDQWEQVQHELRVVTEALEMQRRVVEQQRRLASAVVLDRARPAYRAIVKRMASILAALREAAVDEHKFRHELIDADVSLTSDFINPFGDCGEPDNNVERHDDIARWEREAKDSGAL